MIKTVTLILLVNLGLTVSGQNANTVGHDSATVIFKNISHSKYAEYIAMVRSQLIAGKNLKPGQSRTFKISVAGANINRFTIYLDKDHEYEYNIEPTDYLRNVSDMEITGGTYQYLIDIDKKTDALSVRLEKIN